MSKFKGLTEQETYISLAETLEFGRFISNTQYYFDTEVNRYVALFNGKDLTDSEIWDEFRKSKQKKDES